MEEQQAKERTETTGFALRMCRSSKRTSWPSLEKHWPPWQSMTASSSVVDVIVTAEACKTQSEQRGAGGQQADNQNESTPKEQEPKLTWIGTVLESGNGSPPRGVTASVICSAETNREYFRSPSSSRGLTRIAGLRKWEIQRLARLQNPSQELDSKRETQTWK